MKPTKKILDGEGWKELESTWWLPLQAITGVIVAQRNETLWSANVEVYELTEETEEAIWQLMIDTYGMLGGKLNFIGQRGSSDDFSRMIHSMHLSNGRAITVIVLQQKERINYILDYGTIGPRKTVSVLGKNVLHADIHFGLPCTFLVE